MSDHTTPAATTATAPVTAPAPAPAPLDENQLVHERREKLKGIRQQQLEGKCVAFPNDFKPTHHAADLFAEHDAKTADELAALNVTATAKVAGRMMLKRVMG